MRGADDEDIHVLRVLQPPRPALPSGGALYFVQEEVDPPAGPIGIELAQRPQHQIELLGSDRMEAVVVEVQIEQTPPVGARIGQVADLVEEEERLSRTANAREADGLSGSGRDLERSGSTARKGPIDHLADHVLQIVAVHNYDHGRIVSLYKGNVGDAWPIGSRPGQRVECLCGRMGA
jgi:hypothetical protein